MLLLQTETTDSPRSVDDKARILDDRCTRRSPYKSAYRSPVTLNLGHSRINAITQRAYVLYYTHSDRGASISSPIVHNEKDRSLTYI